ncbi:O-antigen polymerase [[Eubacterium] hominis]|uniref:O-antigen polymerase n=1 Tax=[Eubacterium] hominis TaxID=2764325 RepID=UPI003A4DF402
MVILLLILTTISCLILSYLYIIKVNRIFNHVVAFNFGMFFYMILPLIIGETKVLDQYNSLDDFYNIYNGIETKSIIIYLLFISVLIFTFFWISYRKKSLIEVNEINAKERDCTLKRKNLLLLGYTLSILCLIYLLFNINHFFKGYTLQYSGVINRGTFAAITLIYLAYYLIYVSYDNKINKNTILFTIILFILNIALLSLGTRMYIVSTTLCVLSFFEKPKTYLSKLKIITPSLFIAAIIILVVGAIRSGIENFSLEVMIINFLIEFLYTSLSLLTFLANAIFDLINLPIVLLSYLINLIPSFLFPNKLDFVVQLESTGYPIYSPGGALNLYVDLIVNFGIIGSIGFVGLLSYCLSYLEERRQGMPVKIIYSFIVSFLFFSIYRDGFASSLIKNILEFSIIIPICLFFISSFSIQNFKKKYKEKNK